MIYVIWIKYVYKSMLHLYYIFIGYNIFKLIFIRISSSFFFYPNKYINYTCTIFNKKINVNS